MKRKILYLVLGLALMNTSCANIFLPAANTTTDEAIYEDAVKALNKSDFDTAVTKFELLSAKFRSDPAVAVNMAGAYAGQCGFTFASYFQTLTSGSMGSDTLFVYLMKQWTSAVTTGSKCRSAEDTMKTISATYVGRNASQSLFMVLLGMAKIGIYLREIADTDRDGAFDSSPFNGHNGSTESFCSSDNISDANVANIGAGLGIVLSNLANIGTVLSGSPVDTTAISNACATMTPNPCLVEDEATILADATMLRSLRVLLNTPVLGHPSGLGCP